MLGLQYFTFAALWNPWQMALVVAIGALYLWLTGPKRSWFPDSKPVPVGKKVMFLLGIAAYYFAQGGPLNLLGHLMFSAHMAAMSVAYLVAPPLILLGVPEWMVRPLISRKPVGAVVKAVTQPLITVVTFNILFSFYHLPLVHDYVMTHYTVHTIFFFVLLIAAFMMWWPIIAPIPELNGLSELKKMGYIFANGVLITPACALIIFASTPVFATYNDPQMWAKAMGYCIPAGSQMLLDNFSGPEFFAILDPQEDQQLGGVIMKILQEITYGSALAYIFFNWYIRERAKDEQETTPVLTDPIV
ncbi:cytochrome c oxidase assembly factor CtaG [Paenibacillus ginsengarvi]|uniref:Cytochrome c oxidase assembly factor CtaG n=1 Tax=Paenibacillus ginsengarvi TaxID=400777 RepID=A0A3B0ALJ2_9BACL|nr:cytochrome c oxidase assembly factor CtaG [Paenibacillus ginsengarvi]RKN61398.1 cytochrome c oxidase assembly factor CtaG [Paenibacillus ginsengarvi]